MNDKPATPTGDVAGRTCAGSACRSAPLGLLAHDADLVVGHLHEATGDMERRLGAIAGDAHFAFAEERQKFEQRVLDMQKQLTQQNQ